MNLYYRSSIRSKLTILITGICAILLVVVGGVFLSSELYVKQASIKKENKILATSLSEQVRHLLVLEKFSQIEQLLKALSRLENIHACYLFDKDGTPVAEYLIPNRNILALPALVHDFSATKWSREKLAEAQEEFNFRGNYYSSFTPIYYEGNFVGSLYLLSDLQAFYDGINGALVGFLCAFVLLVFLSFFLAGIMQKPVSAPLLDLSQLMMQISQKKDYSLRAEKQTEDEIGILVDGFNAMVGQVEKHQNALGRHQQFLENAVQERTWELSCAIEKLESAKLQADEASKAKSDFLSRMTHELRTPLIGVLGMNELLMRTKLDSQQKLLVKTVASSGQELLQLISDVLDFSKIEANKLSLHPSEVEVYHIVETCVELLSPQAFDKGLQLVADIPKSATWTVFADEIRIRQILMNLIGNAIKFTSAGHVVVRLFCSEYTSEQGEFILEVEDSGEGIDDGVAAQIFEAFYQIDGSDTREQAGAGLGLAIVKQLVTLMGGRVDIERKSHGGTIFKVFLSLPVISRKNLSLPIDKQNIEAFVCVPDNLNSRILLRNLHQLGISLKCFRDPADALVFLASAPRLSPALRYCFIDISIAAKNVINALIQQNKKMSDLQVFWLCADRSQLVELPSGEALVYYPITWDSLYRAIVAEPVRTTKEVVVSVEETQDCEPEVFIFSQNAASRELLRLGIQKVVKNIAVFSDYNYFKATNNRIDSSQKILFFDIEHLEMHTYNDIKADGSDDIFVAITKKNLSFGRLDGFDLILYKPLLATELQKLENYLVELTYLDSQNKDSG